MAGPDLLQRIINAYSKKNNSWDIKFSKLLDFINNLVINDESGRYSVFSTNTSDVLTAKLMSLEQAGNCSLTYDGRMIASVKNFAYLNHAVKSAYEKMESNSEYPFPTQSSMAMSFPDEKVKSIHLPEGLSEALREDGSSEGWVYKLMFSGDMSPMIADSVTIRSRMLVLAVNKIRNFLTFKNNANFMYQKMMPAFSKNTRALMDSIKTVQSNPGRAAMAIKRPDEFLFSFWTQMCAFLRKDLAGKESKTSNDEGLLQAAVLINSFILHYKNIIISNKRRQEALRFVGEKLKKEPYYFTISDIYGFRDKQGPLLNKKYRKDDLHDFINDKLKIRDNQALPELIKLKTVNNKMYYIHKSVFLTLVHKKIGDAHDYYRREILDSWTAELRNYRSPQDMNNDENFHSSLEKRIKKEDPLLYAVLGYELLYLAISDCKNIKLKAVAELWIDTRIQATKPLPVILNLQRRHLASEVRSIVPFWLTLGFFRKLAAIFGGRKRNRKKTVQKPRSATGANHPESTAKVISGGKSGSSSVKSGGAGRKALEYKRGVDKLKTHFNYSSSDVNQRLSESSSEWNPLIDDQARKNLVKDVNNMVRDYMRKILRETAFAVPDAERVENIADLLAGNKAFMMIHKQDNFKNYIITYILKILSETKP